MKTEILAVQAVTEAPAPSGWRTIGLFDCEIDGFVRFRGCTLVQGKTGLVKAYPPRTRPHPLCEFASITVKPELWSKVAPLALAALRASPSS